MSKLSLDSNKTEITINLNMAIRPSIFSQGQSYILLTLAKLVNFSTMYTRMQFQLAAAHYYSI